MNTLYKIQFNIFFVILQLQDCSKEWTPELDPSLSQPDSPLLTQPDSPPAKNDSPLAQPADSPQIL